MFSGLETCEFEFLEAIPKVLVGGQFFMFNGVLQFLREQDDWLNRDVTSCGESSPADLILNFILKVRMLRFLQHSRLKCNKVFRAKISFFFVGIFAHSSKKCENASVSESWRYSDVKSRFQHRRSSQKAEVQFRLQPSCSIFCSYCGWSE